MIFSIELAHWRLSLCFLIVRPVGFLFRQRQSCMSNGWVYSDLFRLIPFAQGGTTVVEMADSIVVKRLVRNLQYRASYIRVLETYFRPNPGPIVSRLFHSLIEAQQAAMVSISRYLRGLDVDVQDLSLKQKLLDQAADRRGIKARLRFVHYGLNRCALWYKEQLVDKQMTADPELRQLLLERGEAAAASAWRLEGVMAMLGISPKHEPRGTPDPESEERQPRGWQSNLMEDVGQSPRSGRWSRRRWSRR
ncbi:MAG: hypothetical protein PVF47_13720 [Anaerolineae bacterium]